MPRIIFRLLSGPVLVTSQNMEKRSAYMCVPGASFEVDPGGTGLYRRRYPPWLMRLVKADTQKLLQLIHRNCF